MNDAERLAALRTCEIALAAAAEMLVSSTKVAASVPGARPERATLQSALDILVSRYVADPASVGGQEGATWVLNRILAALDDPEQLSELARVILN